MLTAAGASCSLDSERLNLPIFFFFLTVVSRVSCDEDDDPVFKASCGSGVLGCLIAEYQSRSPQIDSMVVSISSAALVTGEGIAAIASEERLGSDRRRRDKVNKGGQ